MPRHLVVATVAYRSLIEGTAAWELLALVLLGGAVSGAYRLWRGALTRRALVVLAATVLVALVVAAGLVLGTGS